MYEGQLKDFVEKRHFRYSKMQMVFASTQVKWAETNDHLDVKLHLLEFTIRFYANVKKVKDYLVNFVATNKVWFTFRWTTSWIMLKEFLLQKSHRLTWGLVNSY